VRCTLSWMQVFPSPFNALFTFLSYRFFFQENSRGTLPSCSDQWWQHYPQEFHEDKKAGSWWDPLSLGYSTKSHYPCVVTN
jgi:hypothetical protein